MALQEDQVREALKQVIDPELFVNIVDLGLIYVVDVLPIEGETEKYNVNIDMTMTSPMCPAGPQLVAETKKYAGEIESCLLYTSPSPRDRTRTRMPSSA